MAVDETALVESLGAVVAPRSVVDAPVGVALAAV